MSGSWWFRIGDWCGAPVEETREPVVIHDPIHAVSRRTSSYFSRYLAVGVSHDSDIKSLWYYCAIFMVMLLFDFVLCGSLVCGAVARQHP